MAKQKPSVPKGTRDFTPVQMAKRNYIFNTIKQVFQKFGFQEIETPAIENLSVLLGKYGDEGDKLLFKILNSGDYLSKAQPELLVQKKSTQLITAISEKGLRYDLTVPLARFVVQHQNDITFPFKRYQIQPVWRADRPQKGRYREFYQCDADIIGSNSLLNEIELIEIIDEVFYKLQTGVTIKINNRKLLTGIAQLVGKPDKITDITVALDKLDKIGKEKVMEEWFDKGLEQADIEKITPILELTGSNSQKLNSLKNILNNTETGLKGIEELETLFQYLHQVNLQNTLELDLTLARGLNYYTGAILEVKSNQVSIGSICGGGRYDDLTAAFGLDNTSGIGISFGADRIFDVLEQLNLFPKEATLGTKIMFANLGYEDEKYSLTLLRKLRQLEIPAEIYPQNVKLKKQLTYANAKNIPYVALVGEQERHEQKVTLKNMLDGTQQLLTFDELCSQILS